MCDLDVAEVREFSGRHEYDGRIQDLSPGGVRDGLARLGGARQAGPALDDPHDEAHLAAFEDRTQVAYRDLELHRRNPLLHLAEMDLACYDREYAPAGQRAQARLQQLAAWPQAVDAALAALDQVSAPVAAALLGGIRGLAAGIPAGAPPPVAAAAAEAHRRLAEHVARLAADGDPDPALGAAGLAALMGSAERIDGRPGQAGRAGRRGAGPAADPARRGLRADRHRPAAAGGVRATWSATTRTPDGVIEAARHWTELAIEFTRDRDLVPVPRRRVPGRAWRPSRAAGPWR